MKTNICIGLIFVVSACGQSPAFTLLTSGSSPQSKNSEGDVPLPYQEEYTSDAADVAISPAASTYQSSTSDEGIEASPVNPILVNKSEDVKVCASRLGTQIEKVISVSDFGKKEVSDSHVLLIKVTGNKGVVNLKIKNAMAGVCIFTAGNQPNVNINVEAPVGFMHTKARGNSGIVDFNVVQNFITTSYVDVSGNSSVITLSDKSGASCRNFSAVISGKNNRAKCVAQ